MSVVYNYLSSSIPKYLSDNIRMLSYGHNVLQLRLSKSADVFVLATKSKTGDQAFQVAGLHARNCSKQDYEAGLHKSCDTYRSRKWSFICLSNSIGIFTLKNQTQRAKVKHRHWMKATTYQVRLCELWPWPWQMLWPLSQVVEEQCLQSETLSKLWVRAEKVNRLKTYHSQSTVKI